MINRGILAPLLSALTATASCANIAMPFVPDALESTDAAPASDSWSSTDALAATPFPPTPSCSEVRATCPASTSLVVRGHATALQGLDGAAAAFAIGLRGVPTGPAAWTSVRDGAFEACVCLTIERATAAPTVASIIFVPGAQSLSQQDVNRATYAELYGIWRGGGDDEDLSMDLATDPTADTVRFALATLPQ
jgi:hypothetical protein